MLIEFTKHTQRFKIKKYYDKEDPDEAKIGFENRYEIQEFFDNAMRDKANSAIIQRIAKDFAPVSCRPPKNLIHPSDQELLENLYSEIDTGKLHVVLKNSGLEKNQKLTKNNEKDMPFEFDFLRFVKKCAEQLKKTYSKIFHSDYHILEKVYHYNENSTGAVPSLLDLSSIKEHTTGWKSWDDPFELGALGALKGAVAFNAANFINLGKSALAAAAIGAKSELVNCQYLVTGKSIICKKWYGSFSIRFNLRSRYFEVAWIRYKGCGSEERMLVELKRKDRILMHKKVLYEHPEVMVPPFQTIGEFLLNSKKNFVPPQQDTNKPIRIGRLFESIF